MFSLILMHVISCLITLATSTHNGRRFILSYLIFWYVIFYVWFWNIYSLTIHQSTDLGVILWNCCVVMTNTLTLCKRDSFKLSHGTLCTLGRLSDNWDFPEKEQIVPINCSINPSNNFSNLFFSRVSQIGDTFLDILLNFITYVMISIYQSIFFSIRKP